MLEAFRLPGEAQQIERIMETFATAYFASGPRTFDGLLSLFVDMRLYRSFLIILHIICLLQRK